ncbi:hypothetical protein [Chachezhania sediminis]|uniref:hypothetical protein n=1 Tax=Chachezhania sediminis TaxID=2599291 RepID=UPI00131B7599|nr:hypothetical protein [Chachezhania sediminis]
MSVIPLPSPLVYRPVEHWRLRTLTATPGPGLGGRQQFIFRETRVWRGVYQVVYAWGSSATEGAYLAFLDEVRGAANTFSLPVPNGLTLTSLTERTAFLRGLGVSEAEIAAGHLFYDDGTGFSDGTGFALPEAEDPVIAADAPVGARIVQLSGTLGAVLSVGAGFSINAFYYRVSANDGGTVTFNPPLRAAVTAGDPVNVNAPKIRVRFVDDAAAESAHAFASYGAPFYLDVIEAFDR